MWRKISWCGVNGISGQGCDGHPIILLNDVWHIAIINFGCVSFKILWIKFKFSRVKIYVVVGYGFSEKHGKVERKSRLLVLVQPPYSPKETGGSHHGGNRRAICQGAGIAKVWENQRKCKTRKELRRLLSKGPHVFTGWKLCWQ